MSPDVRTCGRCGTTISDALSGGLCPHCMLRDALEPDEASSGAESFVPAQFRDARLPGKGSRLFGGYELLGEIARGGMGIVFKARELSLDRLVALKLISGGPTGSADVIERFHTGAVAAAQLDHPNIVPTYEVGEFQGQHFVAMKLIEGGTLAKFAGHPLPGKQAAALLVRIAQAVQHAHERGVLHRDLKPANILLDARGEPYVADFGLARLADADLRVTRTETIMGSPAYMAPEQAAGRARQLTTSADVFSLGVIFYELLTGVLPFQAGTALETMRLIRDQDAVRPRSIQPSVDRDLETICLRCLEKQPERRYRSAQDLAVDLERWSRNDPIHARPTTLRDYIVRSIRRRPLVASLLGGLALVSLIGTAGVLWQARRAMTGERAARRSAYSADMLLAQKALADNNLGRALGFLEKHRPGTTAEAESHWEWRYLRAQCASDELFTLGYHGGRATGVAFTPDSRFLASVGYDSRLKLWDLKRRALLREVKLNAWGTAVLFWGARKEWITRESNWAIRLWDERSLNESQFPGIERSGEQLALSPDQRWLGVQANTGIEANDTLVLDDLRSGERRSQNVVGGRQLAFSATGNRVAVGDKNGRIQILDLEEDQVLASFPAHEPGFVAFPSVTALQFTANGERLVSAGLDGTVKVWNVATGTLATNLTGQSSYISAIVLSPDGQSIATGGADQTIRIWDTATWSLTRILRGNLGEVTALAFSPDGGRLVSASRDGAIKVWEAKAPLAPERKSTGLPPNSNSWLSLNGRWLIAVEENRVSWWNTLAKERVATVEMSEPLQGDGALSNDGKIAALNARNGDVLLVDRDLAQTVSRLSDQHTIVSRLAFSPDGSRLATQGWNGRLILWNVQERREFARFSTEPGVFCTWLEFSGNGRSLAASYGNNVARLFDVSTSRTGKEHVWLTHNQPPFCIALSPDGERAASVHLDGQVKLWDTSNFHELASVQGALLEAASAAWSRDGRRLAVGTGEGTVRIWDVSALPPLEMLALEGHRCDVRCLRFSEDGRALVSTSSDAMFVWEAPPPNDLSARQN